MTIKELTKDLDMKIGKLLRKERSFRGLSQEEFGGCVEVTFQQVQKYERGLNRVSLSTFLVMANFLKIEPGDFLNKLALPMQENDMPETKRELNHVRDFLDLSPNLRGKAMSFIKAMRQEIAEVQA
jgi:transcriptional regulator with XRE-family HTH domain